MKSFKSHGESRKLDQPETPPLNLLKLDQTWLNLAQFNVSVVQNHEIVALRYILILKKVHLKLIPIQPIQRMSS